MSDAPLPLDEFEDAAAWYVEVLGIVGESLDDLETFGVGAGPQAAQFVQSLARRGYTIEKMTDG